MVFNVRNFSALGTRPKVSANQNQDQLRLGIWCELFPRLAAALNDAASSFFKHCSLLASHDQKFPEFAVV